MVSISTSCPVSQVWRGEEGGGGGRGREREGRRESGEGGRRGLPKTFPDSSDSGFFTPNPKSTMKPIRFVLLTALLCQWSRGQQRGKSPPGHPELRLLTDRPQTRRWGVIIDLLIGWLIHWLIDLRSVRSTSVSYAFKKELQLSRLWWEINYFIPWTCVHKFF